MTVYIYDLSDPRTSEVRYIGKSVNPKERLATHIRDARRGVVVHCKRWIDGLLQQGLLPVLGIIEKTTKENANEAECYWIACFRFMGANLTNRTIGGDGQSPGYKPSKEALAKASATTKGRKASPERRARLREAFNRPEVKLRRRQIMLERHADPIKRVPITGPTRGMRLSENTKNKMSKAWTPERKAKHAAEKSALEVDDRWKDQLSLARKKRWDEYRAKPYEKRTYKKKSCSHTE
jgi:hypothetical protein